MFDGRTNLSADVAAEVRRHLGAAVFDTIVPRSIRLSEAPSFGLPIALHRPDSKGAEAYAALAVELLGRNGSRRVSQASPALATSIEARPDAEPVPVGSTRA
jgi:chromosome partitioning protein